MFGLSAERNGVERPPRIARSARVQGACSLADSKGGAFGGVWGNAPGRSGRQPSSAGTHPDEEEEKWKDKKE